MVSLHDSWFVPARTRFKLLLTQAQTLHHEMITTAEMTVSWRCSVLCSCFCVYQVSGGLAEDQTSRASQVPSIRAGRAKGEPETRGRTGGLPASAASRSPMRTSLRAVESSPQTSE